MYILQPTKLTDRQKKDLLDLAGDCRKAEPISLSIPEDADRHLLLYTYPEDSSDNGPQHRSVAGAEGCTGNGTTDGTGSRPEECLAACLLICETPDDVWECYAFTRPDCRRKGYFSRLAEEACRMAEETEEATGRPIDLAFLSDQKSLQGLAAAKALGMTLWYAEYQMERTIGQLLEGPDATRRQDLWTGQGDRTFKERRLFLQREAIREELDGEVLESWRFSAYPVPAAETMLQSAAAPIGTCRLLCHGSSCFYLYHVEIRADMRAKGWGRALLAALFQQLPAGSRLLLQVSSYNAPALALYKKTGFRITETLAYYIF